MGRFSDKPNRTLIGHRGSTFILGVMKNLTSFFHSSSLNQSISSLRRWLQSHTSPSMSDLICDLTHFCFMGILIFFLSDLSCSSINVSHLQVSGKSPVCSIQAWIYHQLPVTLKSEWIRNDRADGSGIVERSLEKSSGCCLCTYISADTVFGC